jgi:DNA-binding response OmpR family regulator
MKKRILVVEDDQAILTGLVDLLEGEGFAVEQAMDGAAALARHAEAKPDLLLLDVMIPEKSGYEVCREIRRTDPSTPVIMLTAKGEEVDKVIGLELGADGDVAIDPRTMRGTKGGRAFDVSRRELALLRVFTSREGEALDRFTLMDEVWGVRYEGTTRTLDQHMAGLRKKVEDNPARPRYFTTVHGTGYRFTAAPP